MAEPSTDCAVWESALAAHALGALADTEEVALQRHLERCSACRDRLEELARTAGTLAFAAPKAIPGPHVRDRLLGRVALPLPAPPRLPRQRSLRKPAWGVAVAAAGLLATNGVWATVTLRQHATVLSQESRLAKLERQTLKPALPPPTASGTARIVMLSGTAAAPAASGELAYDPMSGQAAIVARGLPPVPPERAYQGWLHQGASRISVGLLVTGPTGDALAIVPVPGSLSAYDGFGVSLEPAHGSVRPTGPAMLSARFSR